MSFGFFVYMLQGTRNLKPYVNVTVDFENTGESKAFVRMLIKDVKTKSESWYQLIYLIMHGLKRGNHVHLMLY